jgi:multifunctional methyltransferase subunit TRM112
MKVLTLNFLTCAVKTCKSSTDSFPLHPKEAELAKDDVEINPQLIVNVLPRIDWAALRTTSTEVCFSHIEKWRLSYSRSLFVYVLFPSYMISSVDITKLGFPALPDQPPTAEELEADENMLQELHTILMETQIMEGKLVCGHCGHEYAIREGIANFLLPSHLV